MDLSNIKKIKQQDLIIEWMRGNEGKGGFKECTMSLAWATDGWWKNSLR